MRYLLLFCVCVLAVFDSRVYGKVILKSWQMTTFHGLPNNTVRCLHQDYRGRIWLGTQNGLGMYDGNRVTTFVPVSTDRRVVLSRKIRQIEETSSRHLWILAAGGQAMCFDLCGRRFIAVTPRGDLFLPADHLSKDSRGRIWLWHSRRKGAWCVSEPVMEVGSCRCVIIRFPRRSVWLLMQVAETECGWEPERVCMWFQMWVAWWRMPVANGRRRRSPTAMGFVCRHAAAV